MTTINDIGDLIRVLREQPEWADTLRSVLLSQELLNLPERFAQFVEATNTNFKAVNLRLDRMDQRFDAVDSRLDRMDQRFDAVDSRLDRMDGRLDRMDGRMDNGFGINYELKVERNIASYAGQNLGLRNVRTLHGNQGRAPSLISQSEQRAEDGRISWDEHDQLWLADLIFSGTTRNEAADVNAVAEVSITAGDEDIERALERARILALVIQSPATPVVITSQIDPARAEAAHQRGVTIIQAPL